MIIVNILDSTGKRNSQDFEKMELYSTNQSHKARLFAITSGSVVLLTEPLATDSLDTLIIYYTIIDA